MESLEDLLEQKRILNEKIQMHSKRQFQEYKGNEKIVKSDNPYSRLLATESLGSIKNYKQIKDKCVLIVGVGGVGSICSEMMLRMNIGRLILYDYDLVEMANMNRLFYTPIQVGMTKVQAAKETLNFINPLIEIITRNVDITTIDGSKQIKSDINHYHVDLVLGCVDNYSARMTVNIICLQTKQIWIESGVSEDALSSHIQVIVPGETACFGCASPVSVEDGTHTTIKREGVCAASLPTTIGITAGLLAQCAIKVLLEFGDITYVLGYNAKSDYFQNYILAANPDCKIEICRQHQNDNQFQFQKSRQKIHQSQQTQQSKQQSANEWGIEIIQDNDQHQSQNQQQQQQEVIDGSQLKDIETQDLLDQLKSM